MSQKKILLAVIFSSVICAMTITLGYQRAFSQSAPREHNVNMVAGSGNKAGSVPKPFDPVTLFVHKGDTVTWTNHDTSNHTIVTLSVDSGIIWPKALVAVTNRQVLVTNLIKKEHTFTSINFIHIWEVLFMLTSQ